MRLQAPALVPSRRCAIYTRKSAQPPIVQEITSLESQRAICSAYIASQEHKGWTELSKPYDDAGRSGSNLDRPALQELLHDVESGLVDVVLVYKLDRITRTLLDFVRLIDFFERYRVTFVSITQNFDTSDSMGRLIRNILLTFAQFEREIASDRMRDKKMVMKRRGIWAGGTAPLGYDLKRGKLVVNPVERAAVSCIFETFVETKRIAAVHRKLIEEGHRRKIWMSKAGVHQGGNKISLTSLHHILRNPVYIGELTYIGERHPGIHEPIINRGLWDRAQVVMKEREKFRPTIVCNILSGVLYDGYGRRMVCCTKPYRDRFVRHYESAVLAWAVRQKLKVTRIDAERTERLVLDALRLLLSDRQEIRVLLLKIGIYGPDLDRLTTLAPAAAVRLHRLEINRLALAVRALVYRVEVTPDCVRVLVRLGVLAKFVDWDGIGLFRLDDLDLVRTSEIHLLAIPAAVLRERPRHCLPIRPREGPPADPSRQLLELLADARAAQQLVFDHRDLSVEQLAYSLGRKPASFARLVRLNYLAPDIIASILDGTQPAGLTRRALATCDLPMDWKLQRALLGFSEGQDASSARQPKPPAAQPRFIMPSPGAPEGTEGPVRGSPFWEGVATLSRIVARGRSKTPA